MFQFITGWYRLWVSVSLALLNFFTVCYIPTDATIFIYKNDIRRGKKKLQIKWECKRSNNMGGVGPLVHIMHLLLWWSATGYSFDILLTNAPYLLRFHWRCILFFSDESPNHAQPFIYFICSFNTFFFRQIIIFISLMLLLLLLFFNHDSIQLNFMKFYLYLGSTFFICFVKYQRVYFAAV